MPTASKKKPKIC